MEREKVGFDPHTDLWQDGDVVVLQVELLQLSTLGQGARDGRQPVVPQAQSVDAGKVAWEQRDKSQGSSGP